MSEGPTHNRPNIAAELRPYVDKPDIDGLNEVAERLLDAPPIPRAGFRAELKAHLVEREARGGATWRPKRLGAAIAAYAGGGMTLLALAALGATGAGPLG